MTVSLVISAIMFASGLAALLFETLWFRQAGLSFGNSVWASSLVLSSFMAGLALGNGLVAQRGDRVRHPIRLYAVLEVAIAVSGVALVWVLPALGSWLAPLWRPLLAHPWLLNPLRLLVSFALLLVPATAMGATLPLLVKALTARDPNFGSVLGRLYGWNTLGAVIGAVAGELFLLEWLGVRNSALAAGGMNLVAASAALTVYLLSRTDGGGVHRSGTRGALRPSGTAWRLLGASFSAGGIVLALEVIWFRFLELSVWNTGTSFALMLAVVLAGIGLGGRATGLWLRIRPGSHGIVAPVAFLAGAAVVASYLAFSSVIGQYGSEIVFDTVGVIEISAALMLPVALLSGALFTLTGTALQRELESETLSTGLLTLANTMGGGIGALVGGFLLLPFLGVEISLFLLAATYGGVGLLLLDCTPAPGSARRALRLIWVAPLALGLVFFPFGAFLDEHLRRVEERFEFGVGTEIAAVRETRTETLLLLRREYQGRPLNYLLVTGGFAMASTDVWSRRYMKQFVFLPLNLHPRPERALLISYGTGSTARALVDVPGLRKIDVVDISRDVFEIGSIVYPSLQENPLLDRRVDAHVDDGRFFLLTTTERYDLITSEPPPPKHAGVVNLYTREFFQLVLDRLAEGGINTHWLPVHSLTYDDSRAIVRAYCEVFRDCTLWKGFGINWMLMGSRGARWETSEAEFAKRWKALRNAREDRDLSVELPEQLGAMFIGDAPALREMVRDVEPLQDDFPKRLIDDPPGAEDASALRRWMDTESARQLFRTSRFIEEAWPRELRERTDRYFEYEAIIDKVFFHEFGRPTSLSRIIAPLHELLTETELETLPMWLLSTYADHLSVVDHAGREGLRTESLSLLAARALGRRSFDRAARFFGRTRKSSDRSAFLHAYALAMAGHRELAAAALRQQEQSYHLTPEQREPWLWLSETFQLDDDSIGGAARLPGP
jgi:spermidine synthase